jgi:hypothetical protein
MRITGPMAVCKVGISWERGGRCMGILQER